MLLGWTLHISEVRLHILSYSSRRACPVISATNVFQLRAEKWFLVTSTIIILCSLNLEHTMTSMKVLLYSRWGYFLQIDGQQRIRGVRTKDDYCGKRTTRPEIWLCGCTIRYNYLIIEFNGEVYKPAVLSVPNNWPILLVSNPKCLLLFQI